MSQCLSGRYVTLCGHVGSKYNRYQTAPYLTSHLPELTCLSHVIIPSLEQWFSNLLNHRQSHKKVQAKISNVKCELVLCFNGGKKSISSMDISNKLPDVLLRWLHVLKKFLFLLVEFSILLLSLLCMLWLYFNTKTTQVGLGEKKCLGLKHLFESPRFWTEMVWLPLKNIQFWCHRKG